MPTILAKRARVGEPPPRAGNDGIKPLRRERRITANTLAPNDCLVDISLAGKVEKRTPLPLGIEDGPLERRVADTAPHRDRDTE